MAVGRSGGKAAGVYWMSRVQRGERGDGNLFRTQKAGKYFFLLQRGTQAHDKSSLDLRSVNKLQIPKRLRISRHGAHFDVFWIFSGWKLKQEDYRTCPCRSLWKCKLVDMAKHFVPRENHAGMEKKQRRRERGEQLTQLYAGEGIFQ